MLNYLTKSWEVRAFTFRGEFICVECGDKAYTGAEDDPKPVFSDQWNTQEILETHGLEIFCFGCHEEIR
jgi:hypothetical protein